MRFCPLFLLLPLTLRSAALRNAIKTKLKAAFPPLDLSQFFLFGFFLSRGISSSRLFAV
jgi:hypothetical protein